MAALSESGGEPVWRVLDRKTLGAVEGEKLTGQDFFVDDRYETWAANVREWDFLDRCYRGGRDFLGDPSNLVPYQSELLAAERAETPGNEEGKRKIDSGFDLRLRAAFRNNISAALVGELRGYLASKPPERVPLTGPLARAQAFIERVDPATRESLSNFSLQTAENLLVRGIDYTYTEMALTEEEVIEFHRERSLPIPKRNPRTGALIIRADIRELLGLAPRARHIHPSNVVNGVHDARCTLVQALVAEDLLLGDLEARDVNRVTRYRLFTQSEWAIFEVVETDAKRGKRRRELFELARGPNRLGRLPLTVAKWREHDEDDFRGIGFLADIAGVDVGVYNLQSQTAWALKEASSTQTVYKTTVPSVGDEAAREDARQAAQQAFSDDVAMIDREDDATILRREYPEGTTALEFTRHLVNMTMLLHGFRDRADASVLALSGVAFQRAFASLSAILARIGTELGEHERDVLRVVARYLGVPGDAVSDDVVRYPRSYDLRSLDDLLVAIEKMTETGAPEALLRKAWREWALKYWSDASEKERAELVAAIEEWEPGQLASLEAEVERLEAEAAAVPAEDEDEEEEDDGGGGGGAEA